MQNTEPKQQQVAVCYENVSYFYKTYSDEGEVGQSVGVQDISLEINQGEFVALVGHNGCGKSTLAKLTNGLLLPACGSVKVFGMDTSDKNSIFQIRKNVGMVFQNPDNQMVASIVEEDVAFGPENLGVPQPEIVQRVQQALQQVDMLQFAKNSPHRMSGGQKQRIAIAGALAMCPQVLVLDESTAMLDPQGRKEVLQVAHQLNQQGMTVVLITHFMEEVLDCHRVVVMNKGKIAATGTPQQIFENRQLLEEVGLQPPRAIALSHQLKSIWAEAKTCQDAKQLGEEICQLLHKI